MSDILNKLLFSLWSFFYNTENITVSIIILQNLVPFLTYSSNQIYRSNYLWSQRKRHRYRPPNSHGNLWLTQLLKKSRKNADPLLWYSYVITSEPHISISLCEKAFPINTMKGTKKNLFQKQMGRWRDLEVLRNMYVNVFDLLILYHYPHRVLKYFVVWGQTLHGTFHFTVCSKNYNKNFGKSVGNIWKWWQIIKTYILCWLIEQRYL